MAERGRRRRGQREDGDQRLDEEDQREDRHRHDDRPVAPDTRAAPSGRWPGSRRLLTLIAGPPRVLVDQLEVDVLERVVRLADRQHVGAGRDQRPGDGGRGDRRVGHGEDVGGGAVLRASRRRPAGRRTRGPARRAERAVRTVSVLANSRSRSSSGRPIVRSVVFRIATRSQRRSASSRRWVVRKIVTPRWRSPSISSWTSRAATGSRPEVGSSRNSTSGSLSSARARATRWRRPLDRAPQASCARSARLTASQGARRCGRVGVGHLVQVGEALEVLEHAQPQVQPRRLGHDRDPPPDLDAVLGRQRDPGDRRRARGRRDERAERPDGRRLARRRSARGSRRPRRSRPRTRRRRTRPGRRSACSDDRPTAPGSPSREPTTGPSSRSGHLIEQASAPDRHRRQLGPVRCPHVI